MNNDKPTIEIVLTGGGTGGSVTPLLAVADELIAHEPGRFSFTWIGTSDGVERFLTSHYPFAYKAIASGKLRRYLDLRNVTDIFNIALGFFQALFMLMKLRPRLIITAGSFVSVPVAWAGYWLRIPVLVHQQDIIPGLANKLMAPSAKKVTVAFEKGLSAFGKKAVWIGNPVRKEFINAKTRKNGKSRASVVILGGGTGSEKINALVGESLDQLTAFADVTHITGQRAAITDESIPHYYSYDMLEPDHIADVMANADIVITRAGLGTLSELAFLGKASLIIPMPDSHQEANARYFKDRDAAIVLPQSQLTPKTLVHHIKDLLDHETRRKSIEKAMKESMKTDANKAIREVIDKMLEKQ